MSTDAHCPPHKPQWHLETFLWGARIFHPSRGVRCAYCGKAVCLVHAAKHQNRRNLAMIVLSIILAFYQYNPNRWANLVMGMVVIVLANVLLYYGYALWLYRFGKFELVHKKDA